MNELLVTKDVLLNAKIGGGLISGINQINQLAAGALAVFTDRNEMLTAANAAATLPDRKSVYFAVGSGDIKIGAKISQPVDREPKINFSYNTFVASVKEVETIGLDGSGSMNYPSPLVVGTVAVLRITDTTESAANVNVIQAERYDHVVLPGDTAASITADLIAQVNANTASLYVATVIGVNTGISFTTKDFNKTFEVGTDGIIVNATLHKDGAGSSVIPVFSEGASSDVAILDSEFNSEDGNTSRLWLNQFYWQVPSPVVPGAQYDLVNIQWMKQRSNPIKESFATNKQIIIALVTAPAVFLTADLATITGEAFGIDSGNSETGV